LEPERLIELVEKAKQGDRNALEDLYVDAYNSIYRLALRILKKPEDAEDITQEVYITIQQKISDLREPVAFYAWANQITANKCNRFFNKHKGLLRSGSEDEILLSIADDDPENMPDKALDNEATRKIIMEVIDNLPDNQRMCILLFYYGQLTVADIAEALETNENTIKTRLSMARAKIRAALEEKAEKDGIKLWGVPLVLAPIVREAMENMLVPVEVQARMRDNLQTADAEIEYIKGEVEQADIGIEQPSTQFEQAIEPLGGTSGQVGPKLGAEDAIADSAINLATTTATTSGTVLSTKAIMLICGVVLTAAVTATAIFWPQISEVFSPSGDMPGIATELPENEHADTNDTQVTDEPYSDEQLSPTETTETEDNGQTAQRPITNPTVIILPDGNIVIRYTTYGAVTLYPSDVLGLTQNTLVHVIPFVGAEVALNFEQLTLGDEIELKWYSLYISRDGISNYFVVGSEMREIIPLSDGSIGFILDQTFSILRYVDMIDGTRLNTYIWSDGIILHLSPTGCDGIWLVVSNNPEAIAPYQNNPNIETASTWAQEYITRAIDTGLVPLSVRRNYTQPITRAEFAALGVALYEAIKGIDILILPGRMDFNDTNDINAQRMGYLGVIVDIGGNFAPNNTITREEAEVMLSRLADVIQPSLQTTLTFDFLTNDDFTKEQGIIATLQLFDILN